MAAASAALDAIVRKEVSEEKGTKVPYSVSSESGRVMS